MPVLCVLLKQTAKAGPAGPSPSAVDEARLAKLLCPYRGPLQRVAIPGGALHLSSLARVRESTCVIPKGTRKNASTAWLEIAIDPGGLTFQTDPLGTFPLWCFEDDSRVAITSEVKSLMAIDGVGIELDDDALALARHPPDFSPFRNVRRVSPGAVLRVSTALDLTEEHRTPLVYRPTSMFATEARSKDALDAALVGSAGSICGDVPSPATWGTFLSGGIDSSLATALTSKSQPEVETFTLGTKLGDEYADAEELASHLSLRHTRVFADADAAVAHFERAVFCNETVDGLSAETVAQLGILAQAASSKSVRRIVTGYGADLLFGSMLRHELYMKVTGVDDLQSLIERTSWTGEFSPFFAWSHGIEVHHLFWDPQVMNVAFRIPPQFSFDGSEEKVLLRNMVAERGHMDSRHVGRKKQAMTDGTQFNRLLSSALGLGGSYAYEQKSARCISQLRKMLTRLATRGVGS